MDSHKPSKPQSQQFLDGLISRLRTEEALKRDHDTGPISQLPAINIHGSVSHFNVTMSGDIRLDVPGKD